MGVPQKDSGKCLQGNRSDFLSFHTKTLPKFTVAEIESVYNVLCDILIGIIIDSSSKVRASVKWSISIFMSANEQKHKATASILFENPSGAPIDWVNLTNISVESTEKELINQI